MGWANPGKSAEQVHAWADKHDPDHRASGYLPQSPEEVEAERRGMERFEEAAARGIGDDAGGAA